MKGLLGGAAQRDAVVAVAPMAVAARAAEILLPQRVDPVDGYDDPDALVGRRGRPAELEADVGRRPVLLPGVTRAARGYHVVPRVGPSPASGNDVVHILGLRSAVLALEVVPDEDRPPRQRRARSERDLHEVVEPDDRRRSDLDPLGMEDLAVVVDDLGFAFQGEDYRPPDGDHAQRLVRRIQDQRTSQSAASLYLRRALGGVA